MRTGWVAPPAVSVVSLTPEEPVAHCVEAIVVSDTPGAVVAGCVVSATPGTVGRSTVVAAPSVVGGAVADVAVVVGAGADVAGSLAEPLATSSSSLHAE